MNLYWRIRAESELNDILYNYILNKASLNNRHKIYSNTLVDFYDHF